MNQINAKLDKIIKILENLEISESEDDEPNKNSEAGAKTE